jgi:hypothetical protein
MNVIPAQAGIHTDAPKATLLKRLLQLRILSMGSRLRGNDVLTKENVSCYSARWALP